jgi:hypothetical protein
MSNIYFSDGLDALEAAGTFIQTGTLTAIVKNVSPALVISNFSRKTLPYDVSITAHVKSLCGMCHYRIRWLWKSNNVLNTFWITDELCKNKLVTTLIFKYKKLNKL